MSYSTYLSLSWSISRGRDTYGYNIARITDTSTDKTYRCLGGGYDMTGTVFGHYLADVHQLTLREFFAKKSGELTPYGATSHMQHKDFYGATIAPDGRVCLDGACGISSMRHIAEAIGLNVRSTGNGKGHTTGFHVTTKS